MIGQRNKDRFLNPVRSAASGRQRSYSELIGVDQYCERGVTGLERPLVPRIDQSECEQRRDAEAVYEHTHVASIIIEGHLLRYSNPKSSRGAGLPPVVAQFRGLHASSCDKRRVGPKKEFIPVSAF